MAEHPVKSCSKWHQIAIHTQHCEPYKRRIAGQTITQVEVDDGRGMGEGKYCDEDDSRQTSDLATAIKDRMRGNRRRGTGQRKDI
ncbi:MAG: hypothetical protein HQ482_09105, partial [Sphingomonadales bacterium]|nr:hypothetical protein [Sphingomonadales bacterium]